MASLYNAIYGEQGLREKQKYFMFCSTKPEKERKTEKMRITLVLILLISLATAFKLD